MFDSANCAKEILSCTRTCSLITLCCVPALISRFPRNSKAIIWVTKKIKRIFKWWREYLELCPLDCIFITFQGPKYVRYNRILIFRTLKNNYSNFPEDDHLFKTFGGIPSILLYYTFITRNQKSIHRILISEKFKWRRQSCQKDGKLIRTSVRVIGIRLIIFLSRLTNRKTVILL